ncbi:MAG: hypothetical protein CL608_03790 [Anaerolineaceae bacterium]|nr:hypothetical protein [Anaerolineaceae bacterium]
MDYRPNGGVFCQPNRIKIGIYCEGQQPSTLDVRRKIVKRLAGFLVILISLILVACGSAEPTPPPTLSLSLLATDIAYDQEQLEVMAGQPVKIMLSNEGALEHDFSIMEIPHLGEVMAEEMEEGAEHGVHDMSEMDMDPEVHVAAPIGGRSSVEFTPSTPGEYEFFCTTAGHKEAGMKGTLVVQAP